MAVVMMGGDEKKTMFHDFLGMSGENRASETEASVSASVGASSGEHGLVSGCSDLGSERQAVNNSEALHVHGRKNAISGPEVSNTFSGRKRSNSDSAFIGLIRDRMIPVGSDSLESSRQMKMLGKGVVSERLGGSHDDEMPFTMQPPVRPTSSLILQPPVSGRPDSRVSKWERSMSINPGTMVHYPSRFGQSGTYMDKLSNSSTYKDASVGATLISQAAADEGSRTGIKGSGILKTINPMSGAGERNLTGVLPCSSKTKASQTIAPESTNLPSRHSTAPATRQMTIFYAGQAHVFDDVHPNKADVILALAGSNGGSWSTTYSPKSSVHPSAEAKVPSGENEMRISNIVFPQDLNRSQSSRGGPDHGFSQAVQIPVRGDPPIIASGVRNIDTRPTTPAAEPHTQGKNDEW